MSPAAAQALRATHATIGRKFDQSTEAELARIAARNREKRRDRRYLIIEWRGYVDGIDLVLRWLSKGFEEEFESIEQAEKRIRWELRRVPLFRRRRRLSPFNPADLRYRLVIASYFKRFGHRAAIARAA